MGLQKEEEFKDLGMKRNTSPTAT